MVNSKRTSGRIVNRAAARIAHRCFAGNTIAWMGAWSAAREILDTLWSRGDIDDFAWIERAELDDFENLLVQLSATQLSQLMR